MTLYTSVQPWMTKDTWEVAGRLVGYIEFFPLAGTIFLEHHCHVNNRLLVVPVCLALASVAVCWWKEVGFLFERGPVLRFSLM